MNNEAYNYEQEAWEQGSPRDPEQHTLNQYMAKAMSTLMATCDNMGYSVFGMVAEVGEICDKLAKWIRQGKLHVKIEFDASLSKEQIEAMLNELRKENGDVLWFAGLFSKHTGSDLEHTGQQNIEKLASRQARGVIDGSGDNR